MAYKLTGVVHSLIIVPHCRHKLGRVTKTFLTKDLRQLWAKSAENQPKISRNQSKIVNKLSENSSL